ncbi:putative enoyl-CoA hydratase 1 [compost metagenome]
MTHVFTSAQALLDAEGMDLGRTDWLSISQQRINLFADATGDHQWIHVDPERAASGPFGACIAHGYLTQALANLFMPQLMRVENLAMGVNYGCDRVRFPAPVAVGSRVRGHAHVLRAEAIGSSVQLVVRVSVEIEGQERPGCVVDTISRYTFNPVSE